MTGRDIARGQDAKPMAVGDERVSSSLRKLDASSHRCHTASLTAPALSSQPSTTSLRNSTNSFSSQYLLCLSQRCSPHGHLGSVWSLSASPLPAALGQLSLSLSFDPLLRVLESIALSLSIDSRLAENTFNVYTQISSANSS